MEFNYLERLENGEYEFLNDLTPSEQESIINAIRKSENKINIINGFINYKDNIIYFVFNIIYDMEEYKEEVFELLKYHGIYATLTRTAEMINNILRKTTWGKKFVLDNFDEVINSFFEVDNSRRIIDFDKFNVVLDYAFNYFDNNQEFIKALCLYEDLHTRYLFMKYLVENHPDKINLVYDDITKYLTSHTHQENKQSTFLPEFMTDEDISDLAISIFNSELPKSIWYKIKDFILSNYKINSLGYSLLYGNGTNGKMEFKNDSSRLFETSNQKLQIYRRYDQYVSEQIIDNFMKYLKYFENKGDIDRKLEEIIYYGLWEELKEFVDKYLSLSARHDYEYIKSGTTASCYRIGDYAFKLSKSKWSYEEEICPNLYLIIKNLEEHFIRNKDGYVVAGIEVEKYLSRNDIQITERHKKQFMDDLRKLGWRAQDAHRDSNFGLLDSYKDADTPHPELLPDYFKEHPFVLIDRDMVFRLENKYPKTLIRF